VLISGEDRVSAAHGECNDEWVNSAVQEVTGHVAEDGACNYRLYNNGSWQDYNELKSHVNTLWRTCDTEGGTPDNPSPAYRHIAWAVVEHTGIKPTAGTCSTQPWQEWVDDNSTGSTTINFNAYDSGAGADWNVESAVLATVSECANRGISHAVISVTSHYPDTREEHQPPNTPNPGNVDLMGQCDGGLYNEFGWSTDEGLRSLVAERAGSGATCSAPGQDEQIDAAHLALTGWHPLLEECNVANNFPEAWNGLDFDDLKERVLASKRCSNDPYMGQIYLSETGRQIRGRHVSGECNPYLYGGVFTSNADKKAKVQAMLSYLNANEITIRRDGSFLIDGVEIPADQIWIAAGNTVSFGNGTHTSFLDADQNPIDIGVIGQDVGSIHQLPGDVQIAINGGQIISDNGASLIGQAGGNLIGQAGGNLIGQAGGN